MTRKKPFQIIASNDPRLAGQGYDGFCWVLVKTHPDGTIDRIIANGGRPRVTRGRWRDCSWVADILNEYYVEPGGADVWWQRWRRLDDELTAARDENKRLRDELRELRAQAAKNGRDPG